MPEMYVRRLILLALAAMSLEGCAVGILAAGAAAGAGTVAYAEGGGSVRTFEAPVGRVDQAVIEALQEEGFTTERKEVAPAAETIVAHAPDRKAEVDIEPAPANGTNVKVKVTSHHGLDKYPEVAHDIIERTAQLRSVGQAP